jgi:hypothetical protein
MSATGTAARARATLAPCLCAVLALALGGCGDTLQDKPVSHSALESMIGASFPVYWLGGNFQGLRITEASHDPSGAFSLQYGDCLQGGQGTCTAPLKIVTSPDNSFLPGGATRSTTREIRGLKARLTMAGSTIVLPAGEVIVNVFAKDSRLARAAAGAVVPINEPQLPGQPLPARKPDSGFGSKPLPGQLPNAAKKIG